MFQKYVSTVAVFSTDDFRALKPGQWVQTVGGARGQYLGVTQSGVVVVRYQPGVFGSKRDTRNNATLRQYAKDYGAK
jgi:hypothetical protein